MLLSAAGSPRRLSRLTFLTTMSALTALHMLMSAGTRWVDNSLPTFIGSNHPLRPLKWLSLPTHANGNCHFHEAPIVADALLLAEVHRLFLGINLRSVRLFSSRRPT